VAGHSVGEVAAAHVAGVLSLPDAAALLAARGVALRRLPPGAMAAIRASEDDTRAVLPPDLDVAAVNGPEMTVVSGAEEAVDRFVAERAAAGRQARRLRVGRAYHSRQVDAVLAEFGAALTALTFHEPTLPVVSTVTGRLAGAGDLTTPEYWLRHARRPVRFGAALTSLSELGMDSFVEVGPSGSLSSMAGESVAGTFHPLLTRRVPDEIGVAAAAGELFTAGMVLDWTAVLAGGRPIDLPVYPFRREFYWLGATRPAEAVDEPEARRYDLMAAAVRRDALLDLVRVQVALLLGRADAIGVRDNTSFLDVGLDSLGASRLRNRLAAATGLTLPSGVAFDHPTPARLADHLDSLFTVPVPVPVADRPGPVRGDEDEEEDEIDTVLSVLGDLDALDGAVLGLRRGSPEHEAITGLLGRIAKKWGVTA